MIHFLQIFDGGDDDDVGGLYIKIPTFSESFDEYAIGTMNMFIETLSLKYYAKNDGIYDDVGIKMNELLLVSRIIYSLLNKENHVNVEVHMDPSSPLA